MQKDIDKMKQHGDELSNKKRVLDLEMYKKI